MRQRADVAGHRDPAWLERRERSNTLAIRFIVWVALTLGRPAARLLLYPICFYFWLFSAKARAASRKYLDKVLDRPPGFTDLFRHYHTFAATILDRVFLLNDQYGRFDVKIQGEEIVEDMMNRGEGCILLGAHLGSFEIIRSLGREARGLRISLVMYEENARKLNSVLAAINPNLPLQIIGLGKVDAMLRVEEALESGGFVGLLSDRTIEGEGTVSCEFLGGQSKFPVGPFRLAAMLKRPATQRLVAVFAAGWALLNVPLLTLWDRDATLLGVPLLPAALFIGWGTLIALAGWVAERADD